MAYGFSVFWLPLSRAIGITSSAPDDWKISTLGWMYTLFFVMLGSSAALFGAWVEREGPRKAGVVAACCWGGGFFHLGARHLPASDLAAVARLGRHRRLRPGPRLHLAGLDADQMVSRSPRHGDRPGDHGIWRRRDDRHTARRRADEALCHADVGRRLADASSSSASIYFVAMMAGAFGYRLPAPGWAPAAGRRPPHVRRRTAAGSVPVDLAWKTRQFWLLWAVLCLNVSAGIGVLGIASPMIQEIFKGRVTRVRRGRLHRASQPVQHRRPDLLGVALGSHRPQGDLHRVLRARACCSTQRRRRRARAAAWRSLSPSSASS